MKLFHLCKCPFEVTHDPQMKSLVEAEDPVAFADAAVVGVTLPATHRVRVAEDID